MRRSHPPNRSACRPSRTPAGDSASASQRLEKARQIFRKRCMQFQCFPGERMHELQFPGVQEHALQALLRQGPVELEVAVLVVARDRKSEMGEMDADLMGPSGQELRRQQREIAESLLSPENRLRRPALAVYADAPLPGTGKKFLERKADMLFVVAPASLHQGQVLLLHPPLAQGRVQRGQRRAFFRKDEQSGGFAIEPVRELEELLLRPR